MFNFLKKTPPSAGMVTSKRTWTQQLKHLIGQRTLDDELILEIEELMIRADIGMDITNRVIDNINRSIKKSSLTSSQQIHDFIKTDLIKILSNHRSLQFHRETTPLIILVVGVNGVGKTTTIGKLAHQIIQEKKSVILAAGDTFRAAAIDQLKQWGEKINVPVIAQNPGADSNAVIHDAIEAAKSRNIDIVLADTAGRLHNKDNLMQELQKIHRNIVKNNPSVPCESLLIVDATTGQNALRQVEEFSKIIDLSGIILTKMDGSAQGGIIFPLIEQSGLPIYFIGTGESIDSLIPFDSQSFIDGLFE